MINLRQFGGKVDKAHNERYTSSEHWYKGRFRNLEKTVALKSLWKIPKMLYRQLRSPVQGYPSTPIHISSLDQASFLAGSSPLQYVWYGHSVILLKMDGIVILVDPMFGPDCAPIAPFQSPRFSEDTLKLIDHLPQIDLVLFTHDHYDHLDLDSILRLKSKVSRYMVPLGMKRHLEAWNINPDKVEEMDWWQTNTYNNIEITFTPTRHFSGRGINDRAKSLWGGFYLKTDASKIWISGDGGYGKHFEEIARLVEGVDIAFLECGQYNEDWPQVHLFPRDAIKLAHLAKAKIAIPIHWGAFNLSYYHNWYDPVETFKKLGIHRNLTISVPEPGVIYKKQSIEGGEWWHIYK